MKRLLFMLIVGFGISSYVVNADYVEVKTASGTYGYYTSEYYPYVCYERRVRLFRDGHQYIRYEGCIRSQHSCQSIGMVHFGRYPNNKESAKALQRCINSTPRFVD